MSLISQFKNLLRELECPICNEYLHTNIPVCSQGHSICEKCKEKCSKCPTCKSGFDEGRNYVLENLISSITIPCKYKSDGCKLQRNFVEISTHVNYCEYRDLPCPMNKSHNCPWFGKYQHFKEHFEKIHTASQYRYDIGSAVFYIFHENNSFKISRNNDPNSGLVTWVVQFLGKHENAKNYLFRIEFMDQNNSGMELSMTAECVPECNNDDEVFKKAGISFPVKMLEYFKLEDIYNHKLCILNKRNV